MIYAFVEKIIVHAPEKIDGERHMQIDIYLKFIGNFQVPQDEPTAEEMAEEEKQKQRRAKNREKVARCMERKKLKDAQEKEDAAHEMTALYERISREDRNEGESFSILRQKEYLETYAAANGFENCRHYTDDGFSGRNFERPGWQQMMTDIDGGKIGTVLVKDMSRVGRDYLQTGFYTEIYFKEKDVRFIAIDSHVDNSCSDSLEFAPMLNVLNEMYLHDLSKKVNIGFRAKGMSGQSLTSTPLFGYKRDPEDKNHWVIEPETAEIVRRIFELAATGMNPHRIAKTLQTERRITPSTYFRRSDMGNRYHARRQETGDYDWHRGTVIGILNKREYLGMTVNFKTCTPSYKAKQVQNPIEKQVVFENTHEAIVDRQAWERAHKAFEKPKRLKRKTPTAALRTLYSAPDAAHP